MRIGIEIIGEFMEEGGLKAGLVTVDHSAKRGEKQPGLAWKAGMNLP